jgi:NADH dehydrogenase
MLLVTGGSSFVGRAVLRQLSAAGHPVRALLRPARHSPRLPLGVPLDAALTSLADKRGVRAALVGVSTVIHVGAALNPGCAEDARRADVEGTRNLAEAALEAGVQHLIYLSHLGADRTSAYPLQRAKAEAEEHVRSSGIRHTILRLAVVYGPGDHFTTIMARLLASSPILLLLPGGGETRLQPLWVEDLATCITWMLDDLDGLRDLYEIGGPEYLSLAEIMRQIMKVTGMPRIIATARAPYLKALAWMARGMMRNPPVTMGWVDYLAVNRTASLDTLPRVLGLQPALMDGKLDHLRGRNWGWEMLASQFRARERDYD